MNSEAKLHEHVEKLRGEWELKTEWGKISVTFRPFRIGYKNKKGTPDEILVVKITFPFFGEYASIQVPVLIEMEEKCGLPASLEDLKKFLKRMQSGEEDDIYYKYTELPMFVIGKKRRKRNEEISLIAKIKIKEVTQDI